MLKHLIKNMSTGGFALHGYNEGSLHQRLQLLKASDTFIECLNHISTLNNEQIVIADYGSSEGYNSMVFLRQTLSKFRETSSSPILVFHNDLPDNNWVKTFKTILEFEDSYIKLPNVYFSAIGRSFYDQILPNNSVHIGLSSAALHWLSQPISAPDNCVPSCSNNPEFKALVSKVAHNDLVTLLRQRHKELVSSGRLVIQFLTESISTAASTTIINATTENSFNKGYITEEEKKNITIPMYGRTIEEVQNAINEISDLYRAILFTQVGESRIPGIDNLPDEEKANYVNGLKRLAAASLKGVIQKAVNRSDEERNAIYELFIKEMSDFVDTADVNHWPQYHLLVLEKISS
ncbi:unnamed protein product [Blepharisma stoltei]|uniref:Uncharacterized protein n=1 Tax=Blepharisma stoltei TaxID=1481888 RepID=A0AAU9JM63_9CILI|nr:unnamed protein product [Blepharisma stoltei]